MGFGDRLATAQSTLTADAGVYNVQSMRSKVAPPVSRIGQSLKRLREQRELSCRELAERAGVTHGNISHIELGWTTDPRISTLLAIAKALDVPLSELIDEI